MKIGILTFHRAHNYGAVLQCYALQEVLKSLGHDVEIIDYRQPWIEDIYYHPMSIKYIRRRIHNIMGFCWYLKDYPKRKRIIPVRCQIFETFSNTFLQISKTAYHADYIGEYDVYLIGSDQLWSKICIGDRFDDMYFGNFIHPQKSRIIGYAISINQPSLNSLCNNKLGLLKNFDLISMREAFAANRLSALTHRKIHQTLDPTLLLEKEKWAPLINSQYANRQYVALYQVRYPQGRLVLPEKARQMADVNGWEVIDLSSSNYRVEDFVSIIRYAQCVITSSFHATVFSVIFGVPFYAYLLNDGKDDRYKDLLKKVGLSRHLVELDASPSVPLKVDIKHTDAALAKLRQPSMHYLMQI